MDNNYPVSRGPRYAENISTTWKAQNRTNSINKVGQV